MNNLLLISCPVCCGPSWTPSSLFRRWGNRAGPGPCSNFLTPFSLWILHSYRIQLRFDYCSVHAGKFWRRHPLCNPKLLSPIATIQFGSVCKAWAHWWSWCKRLYCQFALPIPPCHLRHPSSRSRTCTISRPQARLCNSRALSIACN